MLTTLSIQHFAIVKALEIDFSEGMIAFTGETGAGKSIMIDALMLALGARADASVIRPGHETCVVTACFHYEENSEPAQWLAAHQLLSEVGEVYLKRVIHTEGRSKSYINGYLVPLHQVKELGEQLVLIHGQHQHLALLHHATHRQQLDDYAGHAGLVQEVAERYKAYQQVRQALDRLKEGQQQGDTLQLLVFQLEELAALTIQEGEVQALDQEHQLLHHAKEYLERSQQLSTLFNGDEASNLCSGLSQALQWLSELPQENAQIKNMTALLSSALIQCEEAWNELQQFADRVPLDPERLHEVEQRMMTIHHAARKYRVAPSALLDHQRVLQKTLDELSVAESDAQGLLLKLERLNQEYQRAAFQLRESRQLYAQKLSHEMTQGMQQLGMPKGWMEIDISALEQMQVHGLDKVEYKVCTNPGMLPDTLSKIASGGELSRIGLAIQMITARRGATPTLLFDEVDVGIGGATAALVGKWLRELGERLQVFCVTHQPQVAASAHQHFRVEKHSDMEQTLTRVTLLQEADKVDEIARMLGGLSITERTRSHAKELLSENKIKKTIQKIKLVV